MKLGRKRDFIFLSIIVVAVVFASCVNSKKERKLNVDSDGWSVLFDGESFDGWRGYGRNDIPTAWTIDDGAIKINGLHRGDAADGGDIIFDRKFSNFELTFEWKVSKGANSGVFYLVQEIKDKPIWKSSPEYQILDNANHIDAKRGVNNNRQSASLYDLIPAVPQNSKPFGEWNSGRIIVYKGTVTHSQNGEDVLTYNLWTDQWKEMVEKGKFEDSEHFINAGGENLEGYIGLQDHGDDVWFRNIKVKELN